MGALPDQIRRHIVDLGLGVEEAVLHECYAAVEGRRELAPALREHCIRAILNDEVEVREGLSKETKRYKIKVRKRLPSTYVGMVGWIEATRLDIP